MRSSYLSEDVTILLKDITGLVTPLGTKERERFIQSGVHYSQMLPLEYKPSDEYFRTFCTALDLYAGITADAAAAVSERIWAQKGRGAVLVSLARAGTSAGVLIRRYIKNKYGADLPHYTISIIRGRGIDKNAMAYILERHSADMIQFIDGWTGKGAIQRELNKAMSDYPGVNPGLAVLSDPAYVADKCGTHEDFLIATSCLNSTVSGLMSRTFLRENIIGKDDFHGAAYYGELINEDVTYRFIDTVEACFDYTKSYDLSQPENIRSGIDEVNEIKQHFDISDINFVKPGIGEATRVLLRRVPWKILVHSLDDNARLGHLYQLAKEKGVEVTEYPLRNYSACGIIRDMADN